MNLEDFRQAQIECFKSFFFVSTRLLQRQEDYEEKGRLGNGEYLSVAKTKIDTLPSKLKQLEMEILKLRFAQQHTLAFQPSARRHVVRLLWQTQYHDG